MSLHEIDKLLFFFINRDLQNSFFDTIMPFITDRSYVVFLTLFLLLLLKERKNAFIALMLGIASLLLSDWLANTLKHVFERIRPCNELIEVRMLVKCAKSFSLPSNHAVNAFAFITPFCIMLGSRLRYTFAALALLVGYSRVYVGVHYPFDVIAGALFGIFLALTIIKLYQWSCVRYKLQPYATILFLFLLSISLFRIYYIQNGPLDLGPDEAHYWEWSRRLDMSYYSKGPMIAYLIHIGTGIFGDTVFGIRIMAVVFSVLSSVSLYIFGMRLYNPQVGLLSAGLLQIIPLFSAYGILFTIDSPFIFFWILSLLFFSEAVRNRSSPGNLSLSGNAHEEMNATTPLSMVYWRLLGISVGLGLLTKYTMAFFIPCALLFFLLSQEKRRLLLTSGPYTALLISLVIFSPVIIWNVNHDWVTLKHTAGQAHIAEGLQISLQSFLEFLGSQIGIITPLLFIIMVFSLWRLKAEKEGMFLLWFSLPVITFFFLKSIQAKVQANWALSGYISGIVSTSVFSLDYLSSGNKGKKIFLATALALALVVTAVAHYPSMLGLTADLDPTQRLKGWKQLGEEVSGVYAQMSVDHPVFIFSDKYQVASELAFYVKGHPVTYCINLGRRMNQYDLWPGFQDKIHHNAIFVRTGDTGISEKVSSAFERVEKKVFTAYTKKHVKIRDYSLFLCYNFKGLEEEKPKAY